MTAQEWLDELERLKKAAIMPPYYLRKKLFLERMKKNTTSPIKKSASSAG